MYAYLRGCIAIIDETSVVVDCGGVGYEVQTTRRAAAQYGVGEEATLYTHMAVGKDGDISLYGFPAPEEKSMFRRLISVAGVGPKAALSVLSDLSAADVASAVISGDSRAFLKVSGIGKKTAERIVLELKDNMDVSFAVGASLETSAVQSGAAQDAVDGLMGLGYTKAEAVSAVNAVKDMADSPEDIMIMALKRIGM